jgi:hypothetical protein
VLLRKGLVCHTRGRALVDRHYPFTIRGEVRPLVKIDRGSRTTGIAAITDEDGNTRGRTNYNRSRLGLPKIHARNLRWRSRDARRLAATDTCNQGNTTRLLLLDEVGQVRSPAR